MRVLTIIGTRPEAVKMAPVQRALAARTGIEPILATTGQHPDLLDAPLHLFGLKADLRLPCAANGEQPDAMVARMGAALLPLIEEVRPDCVLVQGDTASALAGARAAVTAGVSLGHVEAGLRTYAPLPWPEEPFRCEIDALADQLFAPTELAARNLLEEGPPGRVFITGNSGIDALRIVRQGLTIAPRIGVCPLIFATLHRRESVGRGADELTSASLALADEGAEIVVPLHPNGAMAGAAAELERHARLRLVAPLAYPAAVQMMGEARLILTDSGGIQEEAPALGTPVLVLRDVTERPEAVELGLAALVGLDRDRIVAGARTVLSRPRPAPVSPYGDGYAAERIVAALLGEPFVPFGATEAVKVPVMAVPLPA